MAEMTDRELMQQALENRDGNLFQNEIQAIDDLRERLAQPEQQPCREWVGLTEEEAFACRGRDYFETYRAIEAKLKEKNA